MPRFSAAVLDRAVREQGEPARYRAYDQSMCADWTRRVLGWEPR
jgi:hypothetical protein